MNFLCYCPSFPLCMPQGNSKQRDFSTDLTPRRMRQTLRHSATTSARATDGLLSKERERQRGTAHSKDRERVRAVPFSRMGSRGTSSCMHACMHLPPAGMYACMHLEEAADLKGIGCVIAVL